MGPPPSKKAGAAGGLIMATFKYFGPLSQYTGKNEEQVPVTTLGEARDYIKKKYGEKTLKAVRRSTVIVNNRNYNSLPRKQRFFGENDIVYFFPPTGGG